MIYGSVGTKCSETQGLLHCVELQEATDTKIHISPPLSAASGPLTTLTFSPQLIVAFI